MSDNQQESESVGDKGTGDVETSTTCTAASFTTNDTADPIITIDEILNEEIEREKEAKALLGGQDDTVCTYPEGYKARQALYSCLTCVKEPEMAAVCYGCALNCHDGHDTIELYTKRNIRCDCGNSKFGTNKCNLYEEKYPTNTENQYGHNYVGKFCTCDFLYGSGTKEEVVYQCIACEDWFHLDHIGVTDTSVPEWKGVVDGERFVVCKECSSKHPCFSLFDKVKSDGKLCLKDPEIPPVDSPVALGDNWREKICNCNFCEAYFEDNGLSYLLSPDDDIAEYHKKNLETKDEEIDENKIVDALVKEAGRDVAINVIRGFHDMKAQIASFFQKKAEDGVGVITEEHVRDFFSQIKRPRLDNPDDVDLSEGAY